jgi:transposase
VFADGYSFCDSSFELALQKKSLRASEQGRADVKQAREQWQRTQSSLDASKLVFLDESGAKTNMTRLRGRAKAGQRCIDDTPHGHWYTTTLISSVRLDGSTACMAIDGATTGEILCPTLKPGDIVILDNLGAHKRQAAIDAIESTGAEVRFLPPYSPDLNPIEKMWSKIKEFLRAAKARTQETLYNAIAAALKTITSKDAIGWFQSCGYVASQN